MSLRSVFWHIALFFLSRFSHNENEDDDAGLRNDQLIDTMFRRLIKLIITIA